MEYPVKVFVNNNVHVLKNNTEWHLFVADYRLIKAAGGIVWNEKNEILLIKRFGKWEFPKGKVEEVESIKTAAIREVKEETGLQQLSFVQRITSTYHTYICDNQNMLKKTYWFVMRAESCQMLKAQKEEGITAVLWIPYERVSAQLKHTYRSIFELWKIAEQFIKTANLK